MLGGIVRVGNGTGARVAFGLPLMRAAGALGEFPVVLEKVVEEVVAPFGRRGGPGDFQAAGDGVAGDAGGVSARPAESLLFNRRAFGFFAEVGAGTLSVRLAE